MKQDRQTFSQMLEQIGRQNSERLMLKARLANRLAKKLQGINRQTAYKIKANALYALVKKLPNCVRVSKDIKLMDFVVVELKREQSGLHLPFTRLVN